VIWPEKYDPKTSAIYALNDIDVKAPPLYIEHLNCRVVADQPMGNEAQGRSAI
jgi:hypothetical protein